MALAKNTKEKYGNALNEFDFVSLNVDKDTKNEQAVESKQPADKTRTVSNAEETKKKKEKIPTKSITMRLPENLIDDIKLASRAYGHNATKYISKLIKADMEKNRDLYQSFPDELD